MALASTVKGIVPSRLSDRFVKFKYSRSTSHKFEKTKGSQVSAAMDNFLKMNDSFTHLWIAGGWA
jgi:hypothetical protein